MYNNYTYNGAMYNDTSLYMARSSIISSTAIVCNTSAKMTGHALLASNTLCNIQIIKSVFGNSLISSSINIPEILYQRIRRINMQLTTNVILTINTGRVLYVYPYAVNVITDVYGIGVAANYIITTDGILYPFGMYIMSDYRSDVMPSTRDYIETVPGRNGTLDFGTDYAVRAISLHGMLESYTPEQTNMLKRQMAQSLNPTSGVRTLIFADDYQKVYYVKYSGQIDLIQYPAGFEVTLPFKMSDPYIYAAFEKMHVGDGIIDNTGNVVCPMLISIYGPVQSSVSIYINSFPIILTGNVPTGETVNIDTHKLTAYRGTTNIISQVNNINTKLVPGTNLVTIDGIDPEAVTITYRERWI